MATEKKKRTKDLTLLEMIKQYGDLRESLGYFDGVSDTECIDKAYKSIMEVYADIKVELYKMGALKNE